MPDDRRCDCGGTLEASNIFPVDALLDAEAKGRGWGVEVVGFFGCRACGAWFVMPAVKKPDGSTRQTGPREPA